jgi:hypothetical protein
MLFSNQDRGGIKMIHMNTRWAEKLVATPWATLFSGGHLSNM